MQIFGPTLGNPAELSQLLEWCAQGRLQPLIDAHFGLADIHAAFSRLESGKQFGKIVLDI